ncbi:MAG: alpha/beta hydrolase [Rhodoferax sp.]|nr:alpha/beta hydrolase [Rhodoferax sp.]
MIHSVSGSHRVLLLPGWQDSGPAHWQSRWEALHGFERVQQHDWMHPLRGDWVVRLEEAVLETPPTQGPVWLVAHSLGCLLVAAWAALSRQTHRIGGALLVAPGDPEQPALRAALHSWVPVPLQPLPFAARVLASDNDPCCRPERAQAFASAWGAGLVPLGPFGHLNAESGLGDWPQGLAHLQALQALPGRPASSAAHAAPTSSTTF